MKMKLFLPDQFWMKSGILGELTIRWNIVIFLSALPPWTESRSYESSDWRNQTLEHLVQDGCEMQTWAIPLHVRLVLIFMWVVHGFISSDPNMTSASWSFSPIPCALFAHRSHHKQWICVGRRQIHGFSVLEAVLADAIPHWDGATMKGPPIHGPRQIPFDSQPFGLANTFRII